MIDDTMKEAAKAIVKEYCSEGTNFSVRKVYENIMDGTLIQVAFQNASGSDETGHVHFGKSGPKFFRWFNDVLNEIGHHKERNFFFRLLELSGIGGVIALTLIFVFSILLSVLAFTDSTANPTVVEVVKLSFTIILGFFFGSQTGHKKV